MSKRSIRIKTANQSLRGGQKLANDEEKVNGHEPPNDEMDWEQFFQEEVDEDWEIEKKRRRRRKSLIVKIVGSLLAFSLLISGLQIWFNLFNIPAFHFIQVSQRLSNIPEVSEYKKAVVTIEWDTKKGTGFNINEDGLIVTNHHVVEDANIVNVHFKEKGSFVGKVISSNPELDLAIVDIEAKSLPYLAISHDNEWDKWLGEKIIFIGNPLAFTGIANEGTVTAKVMLQESKFPFMMIEAPIYKGNSGSPVINENGEVIAVIFATISSGKNKKRVGVATPTYHLDELIKKK